MKTCHITYKGLPLCKCSLRTRQEIALNVGEFYCGYPSVKEAAFALRQLKKHSKDFEIVKAPCPSYEEVYG